ncbi:uncharacterized protein C7orf57 homolog isoform X1 [Esox lucius]|uniref:Uncharacterized protein n=1 Tax=Esox lucius TaxID=8010 RepID=A0A3P8YWY2_ESOLU|nr:uncharacterized protein C7orf57 homolog isoform X1 [Esox lucius]XP_010888529.1 uncharacterized protein C7orf57 homolog isoform X1 [Esox lucius]XP_019897697.1 uncharacterized protein C7orf57 homolog isoform X1 [Esox lucius]
MSAAPNHRRTKPGGMKTGFPGQASSNGVMGPTSQIPGLCQEATTGAPEARTSGRRVGIFESDSDYVKLAKAGGQKGLLWHEDNKEEAGPNKSYNAPDWFSAESQRGSKATSPDGCQGYSKRQPLSAPFGTDDSSGWERESDSFKEKRPSVADASNQMENMSLNQGGYMEVNKYKKTQSDFSMDRSHDKKTAPVSMSKLLSFGYIEDEKKSTNDDDSSSVTSEQTTIAPEDNDLE